MTGPRETGKTVTLGGGIYVRHGWIERQLQPGAFASGIYRPIPIATRCPACRTVWDRPRRGKNDNCPPCRKLIRQGSQTSMDPMVTKNA